MQDISFIQHVGVKFMMYVPLRFALRIIPRHVDVVWLDITAMFREILAQLCH